MVYPSWRYHKDGKQEKIVHSNEEDAALGSDWASSPADWEKKEHKEHAHKEHKIEKAPEMPKKEIKAEVAPELPFLAEKEVEAKPEVAQELPKEKVLKKKGK